MKIQDLENSITTETFREIIKNLSSEDRKDFSDFLLNGRFCIQIPKAMYLRGDYTEMNAYRLVLLLKLFEMILPTQTRANIFNEIKYKYGYFLSYRQFNNIIKRWNEWYSKLER